MEKTTLHYMGQKIEIEPWDACRFARNVNEIALRPSIENILEYTDRVPYEEKTDYIIKRLSEKLSNNQEFRNIFENAINELSDDFDKIENEKDPEGARLKRMLYSYNSYCADEFDNEPLEAWPEDGVVGLAYTTYEFEEKYWIEHSIQVDFNVKEMKYKCYIDDVLVHEEDWDEETFIGNMGADFCDLIRDAVHIGFDMAEEGFIDGDFLTEEEFKRYKESKQKAC